MAMDGQEDRRANGGGEAADVEAATDGAGEFEDDRRRQKVGVRETESARVQSG